MSPIHEFIKELSEVGTVMPKVIFVYSKFVHEHIVNG